MQSEFRFSSDGVKAMSERKDLPSEAEEYGLHIDYFVPDSIAKMSAKNDTTESIAIYGMVFRVDPLTRELVLQEQSIAGSENSNEENESKPGDILCKVSRRPLLLCCERYFKK
jgi:hypothetical protein